jgi:hypothetical protein
MNNCTNLTSISLPDGMTQIGDLFMNNCTNLTSISFPNSLTQIGHKFMCECNKLTSIELPNSLTQIGDGFMNDCKNLTEIKCSEEVKKILLVNNKKIANIVRTDFYICKKCEQKFPINILHCDICDKTWDVNSASICICKPINKIVYNYYKKI